MCGICWAAHLCLIRVLMWQVFWHMNWHKRWIFLIFRYLYFIVWIHIFSIVVGMKTTHFCIVCMRRIFLHPEIQATRLKFEFRADSSAQVWHNPQQFLSHRGLSHFLFLSPTVATLWAHSVGWSIPLLSRGLGETIGGFALMRLFQHKLVHDWRIWQSCLYFPYSISRWHIGGTVS